MSRGLTFCPTPRHIDWAQVKADINDFSRRLRLKEFFYDDEINCDLEPNPFRLKSTWCSPANREPLLDMYINSVEEDVMTAKPTRIRDNLTRRERQSLKKLRRRTDIVIKPADKGSGTVVMNRQSYLDECYRQLNDQLFYKRVTEDPTEDINKRVRFYLKRLLADKIIDKETHRYLTPHDPKAGRFYILPKVHKPGNPGRPIVSANGHPTEKISEFVSYHLNPLVQTLPSYIKNTTHLLNKLKDINTLPSSAILVTLNVSSLYTNIPTNEGIDACRKVLDQGTEKSIPTESLCDLMRMILTMNNFVFNGEHFIQQHGTAMGTRMAPAFANLFMGEFEKKALEGYVDKPFLWFRYIDDIFMV